MIVIFRFEFVTVECINRLVNRRLAILNLLIHLIHNIRITLNLPLHKLNHQHPILRRFPIEEHNTMRIDRLIKNNILDLASRFTVEHSQLIDEEEEELEFELLVFAEF